MEPGDDAGAVCGRAVLTELHFRFEAIDPDRKRDDAGRQLLDVAGVRRRHPDYDDRRVRLAAIKLAIGADLFKLVYPGEDVEP